MHTEEANIAIDNSSALSKENSVNKKSFLEDGVTVACIFALLPDKTASSYKTMWDVIAEKVHIHVDLTVLLDFEKAAWNAAG